MAHLPAQKRGTGDWCKHCVPSKWKYLRRGEKLEKGVGDTWHVISPSPAALLEGRFSIAPTSPSTASRTFISDGTTAPAAAAFSTVAAAAATTTRNTIPDAAPDATPTASRAATAPVAVSTTAMCGTAAGTPLCGVCSHRHHQGVRCAVCGHVGSYLAARDGPCRTPPAVAPTFIDVETPKTIAGLHGRCDTEPTPPSSPRSVPATAGEAETCKKEEDEITPQHTQDAMPPPPRKVGCGKGRPISRVLDFSTATAHGSGSPSGCEQGLTAGQARRRIKDMQRKARKDLGA